MRISQTPHNQAATINSYGIAAKFHRIQIHVSKGWS
jgi:hypothetical protein